MDVSFYNNGSTTKKTNQDLECLETIAELDLRVLPHRDDNCQITVK